MSTPVHRSFRRDQCTPSSTRKTHVTKTPQSGLTPNNDKAEIASARRKRRSEALRKSLADTFVEQEHDAARPTLSTEALNAMFEQCIKLAAENKITDKNVWQLNLIQHLPNIVLAGQVASQSAFNFQKISGGLDAGVTIYSKRVDHTYKEALQKLQGKGSSKDEADDDAGYEDDGEDAVEDAAGAAAKQAKQQGAAAKRSKQGAAKEEATLATAEQLRQKKVDTTFAVDPLFHKMSALFDEGGAKGLLLLNRSVYSGARIMTDPHDVPEQHFPLQASSVPDVLINLKPLSKQLTACQTHSSAAASAEAENSLLLTPDLHKLYSLLEQATANTAGQQQQSGAGSRVDVAAVMAQATRGLPPTPMPRVHLNSSTSSARPASTAEAAEPSAADSAADMDLQGGAQQQQQQEEGCLGPDNDQQRKPEVGALSSAMDEFMAEAATAGDEDGQARTYDDSDAYADDNFDNHPGFEDEEVAGTGNAAEDDNHRRQSIGTLGLGGSMDDTDVEVLDAAALQELLGAGSGKSTNKYRAKAAAIARMAGGATAKKAATATGRGKNKSPLRLDFTNIPELPDIVKGTRKQTCLVKTVSKAVVKQLPQGQQYQVANLARLALRPTAISALRLNSSNRSKPLANDTGADEPSDLFNGQGAGDDADWGGYEDDVDFSAGPAAGADGYNAGDLSTGDPGYNNTAGAAYDADDEDGAGADWWNADSELLKAPKRAAGLGVSYNRSAKQVDVRALKDLLWDSLVTVNQQAAGLDGLDSAPPAATGDSAAGAPTIPFQDVIVSVPEQSDAGELSDVSVHMCFICLLHLANEKGLVIKAKEDLKTLTISNVQVA